MNKPDHFVDEMLEGVLAAHSEQLASCSGNNRNIVRAKKANKVALVSGGGSGHLPLFLGYVGEGLLDGCAVGGIFQSPSADQIFKVTKHVDSGKGVIYLYGNYSGDIMNFQMASEMAEMDNIKTAHVVGNDDVASAPKGEEHKRRGVAGLFYIYKTAGAAAEEGTDFDDVLRIAEKVKTNVRTMGVALSPCIIPEVGSATFSIGENEMEVGMGIHGEPGVSRTVLKSADEVTTTIMESILADAPLFSRDEVSVLINGLGATPKEELYIIYRKVAKILASQHVHVFHAYVGEFATSMEMAGFSISLCRLDGELKRLLAKSARTPFFEQAQL